MATLKAQALIPTREEILDRARALTPALRERAEACEAARMLPAETIADYRKSGLIRIAMPKRYSGYEMGWDVLCEVSQILAAADGSQARAERAAIARRRFAGRCSSRNPIPSWISSLSTKW